MPTPQGTNYPGTNTPVTKSYDERLEIAEFDDALIEQSWWKNPRYAGSKNTQQKFNQHTVGDSGFQDLPSQTNKTTALYLADTVVGGTEDEQFATLQGHSYVSVNKILIINTIDDSVQILDKSVEPFQEFHRFITNDFPTGARAKLKVLDESISNNLSQMHRVKMNKGWLLKSLRYQSAGDISQSAALQAPGAGPDQVYLENNSLYFYKSGSVKEDYYGDGTGTGTVDAGVAAVSYNNQLRFRYGVIEIFDDTENAASTIGGAFAPERCAPSYASSSFFNNKFTRQFYSGAFGFITHQPVPSSSVILNSAEAHSNAGRLLATAFGSASKFIADSLPFLSNNINDSTLETHEKTEMHITFFEGTKDFAPGFFDERSISTFEVDQGEASLGLTRGDHCNGNLPTHHELLLKGPNEGRFMPTTTTFNDSFNSNYLIATASGPYGDGVLNHFSGCIGPQQGAKGAENLQEGVNGDIVTDIECYVQGGALGMIGYTGVQSSSNSGYGVSNQPLMTSDNFYSGSFTYELSFLDKDHTLIMDVDKTAELFDGIGNKGLLIIPEHSLTKVRFNIEYYLEKAGILTDTTNTTLNIATEIHPRD